RGLGKRGSPSVFTNQPSGCIFFGGGLGLVTGEIAESVPNETDKFAGHSDERFVAMNTSGEETHKAAVKAGLRFPTDFHEVSGLALLTARQVSTDLRRHAIMLSTFD